MNIHLQRYLTPEQAGICSVCSAHPAVIEASLAFDRDTKRTVLIEATSNQVNQFGGYTSMRPADFRAYVERIAEIVGFDTQRLWLGGDHLGPNPWSSKPAEEAMQLAEAMVREYVEAGFTKIHLDASMPLGGDEIPLDARLVAERAARLCRVAEAAASAESPPVYIIGTEVPIPGGETEGLEAVSVTTSARFQETVATHRDAFQAAELMSALDRVLAVVVQPGVDFSDQDIMPFDPIAARELITASTEEPSYVFEAHSTDYQSTESLAALVHQGFVILKVGPELTFAYREGLFALAAIEQELIEPSSRSHLRNVIEQVMCDEPAAWQAYYHGDAQTQKWLRGFSYSDRIRYYWNHPIVSVAVNKLMANLRAIDIPMPLLQQYFGLESHSWKAPSHGAQQQDLPVRLLEQKLFAVLKRYRYGCDNSTL
ncbi:class II D-tagatose-bisphosphate aldolase, non-catalytic subunit [Halomonas eurihalina]|uniref:Class II D-tagatose-bisphosphate aldolase, non-catalytic subunit n=1 Tax=Halomonas eurihalina TaxID=42566 RepID=A0A5D9DBR2_HALER|nr:class II D-tagatose-bisphosphate aldolase, non-catalytic subunit [Halomonas eurihalina]MDR5858157.1 class II D-tagatose-bisphosphate aldolase, non-catalytic subunit [Halomonas eurihalina]TZG41338.1 class II D-tagatose-bisphosphate aldolase, non-catalytic subunit [Halomonas eurihalina]